MSSAGLRDACEEVGCAEPNRIDRIFVRNSSDLELVIKAWSVEKHFVDGQGVDLSDHDAIAATIQWQFTGK